MTESWFNDGVRAIFATIDRAVFSLIATVYEILLQITNVNVFGPGSIEGFANKIYGLLGLIMLFKVTFSFITYIVNPDDMNDKTKGAHKIILNVLIVLAMIIIVPTAFDKLYEVQDGILKENVISRFILGTDVDTKSANYYKISESCDEMAKTRNTGDYISIMVFRPFFQLETSEQATVDENILNDYCNIGSTLGDQGTVSKYLTSKIYNSAPDFWDGMYMIDYKFFISTVVGVVVLLLLVSFCFDVAVRTLKLAFLQIIAPIPIISYIDPKSGKNGIFSKWIKEVGKTWADLFIRLAALFFGVYAIQAVTIQQSIEGLDQQYKFWVDLFLIIGALMFAKKLPKLLESLLGIKLDSNLTLNPMKKIRDNALGGKAITGALKGSAALAVGAGLGTVANSAALISNLRANVKKDGWEKGFAKTFQGESTGIKGGFRSAGTAFGILAGGVSAGVRGAYGTYKNDSFKKGIMPGVKKSVDNRDKRDKEQDVGYGIGTKILDKFRGMSGIKTEAKIRSEQAQSQVARLQAAQQSITFQQQQYMSQLNSDNINKLSNITVEQVQDANGQTIDLYSFVDELGKKIKIDGVDTWNETDFKDLISDSDKNVIGKITGDIGDVMDYAKLQAKKNSLDKPLFSATKTQKTFAEKDAEAKK